MDLILILGMSFSVIGASMYAIAHHHNTNNRSVPPTFKRIGKDGFGKHNNFR